MNFKETLFAAALFLSAGTTYASTISITLGQSNQNYTLIGTGGSGGYATYLAQQGDCTAGTVRTTCTLSGIFSGTTSGYTSGSYSLITTYDNADRGLPAISTNPVASPDGGNYFTLPVPFSPDVMISLYLADITGPKTVPMVVNGVFVADNFFVTAVNPTCTGLPSGVPCTQGNVGLSNGASIYSPVTGTVISDVFYPTPSGNSPVPEPEWLALGGLLPGAFLALRRRSMTRFSNK